MGVGRAHPIRRLVVFLTASHSGIPKMPGLCRKCDRSSGSSQGLRGDGAS